MKCFWLSLNTSKGTSRPSTGIRKWHEGIRVLEDLSLFPVCQQPTCVLHKNMCIHPPKNLLREEIKFKKRKNFYVSKLFSWAMRSSTLRQKEQAALFIDMQERQQKTKNQSPALWYANIMPHKPDVSISLPILSDQEQPTPVIIYCL